MVVVDPKENCVLEAVVAVTAVLFVVDLDTAAPEGFEPKEN